MIPRPGAFLGFGPRREPVPVAPARPAPRAPAVRVTRLPEPAPQAPPAPRPAPPPHPSLVVLATLARSLEGALTRASVAPTVADLDVICDAIDVLDAEASWRLSALRAEIQGGPRG